MLNRDIKVIEGKAALIVIDLQNDFIDCGAPIECANVKNALFSSKIMIEKARKAKIPVIFTQEYHRNPEIFGYNDFGRECDGSDPVHTVLGTKGFELSEELLPLAPNDYVLLKPRYSCFIGTDLELILRSHNVETLIITGVCTNICVHYTFIDAHQKDYFVRVVEECVAGTSDAAHEAALTQMNYLQEQCVQSLDTMLDALSEI